MDAALPDAIAERVPGWASTPRGGRLMLSALAAVMLLGWPLLLHLIL
ncbi:hypothetical protein [Citricoccus sp. I39-566]|nr:hypothetical protein [Citricoccus sp. I39-566]WMY79415.1 hypothetical protein RE421_06000 [Citricoccus sp. I39-566]